RDGGHGECGIDRRRRQSADLRRARARRRGSHLGRPARALRHRQGSLRCEGPCEERRRLIPALTHSFSGELVFDHVVFGVSDYAASKAFYLKALAPLGAAVVLEGPLGLEISADGKTSLCIGPSDEKPAHLHLASRAENRQQVEAFYRAALAAGGKDNGAPGLRPEYHANYYAAFVIGPDGHNIEAVCHEPEADDPD